VAEPSILTPAPLEQALDLPPIPGVAGLRVTVAPIRAAVGLASTHGSAGLPESLEGVLGHRLDRRPGSCQGNDPCSIWTAPDRWLVTSDRVERFAFVAGIMAAVPRSVLVTDVTDGLPAIELTGSGARALLAHGCSVEVADGCSARTLLALQPVTLVARGDRVRVFVDRSLVPFLWSWIGRHVPLVGTG
jgi:sarcosine oxidase subunit gamma